MRRGEGNITFGSTLGELLFVEPIECAAGDEFDRHARLLGEFLGDRFSNKVAPAATPNTDDEFILRLRGYGNSKGKECEQKAFHGQILYSQPAPDRRVLHSGSIILHQPTRLDNRTYLAYIRMIERRDHSCQGR